MKKKQDDARNSRDELAALAALGALSPDELHALESEFQAAGNPSELNDHYAVVERLSEEAAAAMPAPRRVLRDKIIESVAAHESVRGAEFAQQMVIRAAEGEWKVLVPGIQVKFLFFDPVSQRHTLLAKVAPGAGLPKHRHVGTEECLILEGELITNEYTLRAGDYLLSQEDQVHYDTHSKTGCTLLLVSPLHDEFMVAG
jgi:anti-sigma factor ChrR (cupin superfamily)